MHRGTKCQSLIHLRVCTFVGTSYAYYVRDGGEEEDTLISSCIPVSSALVAVEIYRLKINPSHFPDIIQKMVVTILVMQLVHSVTCTECTSAYFSSSEDYISLLGH